MKRRILIGTYVLSHGYYDAYYLQAQKIRRLIAQDFTEAFKQCDVIMGPTVSVDRVQDRRQGRRSGADVPVRHLHHCRAARRPAGHVDSLRLRRNGLPVGLQIIGNYFAEARMLNVAHHYQQATDWHLRMPRETPL